MKGKDPRTLGVVAGSALVLLVGLLVVQHLRHGWPFSLHHGMGAASTQAPAPASGSPGAAPTHPRTEVMIDPAQAESIGVRIEKVRVAGVLTPTLT